MENLERFHPLVREVLAEDVDLADSGAQLALFERLDGALRARDAEHAAAISALEERVGALEASRNDRFRSVLRGLSDGLCTLDAEGRCMSMNTIAAKYIGGSSEDLIGEQILGSFKLSANHENSPHVFHLLWTSIKMRLALRFEQAILLRPDGSKLAVSCAFNPLIEHGEVIGCVFVFRDVSAARRAEEELKTLNEALLSARDEAIEASKSKSTFLANMSHELRTPLNAIIGYSELVAEDAEELDGGEFIAQDVQKIHAAAGHLLDIINDILDVSKIEAGKMEVFAETFEIAELVESVASTVEPLINQNNNTLEIALEGDIGLMHTDKIKLRQSLLNLLSNASKFTEGGVVSLRIWREFEPRGEWLNFEVQDSGIGIPEDRIAHLFDSFTQADQSTTRRFGGTGLGLTITYQFCHMMGGEVTASSEVGRGSLFTIRIPARLDTDGASEEVIAIADHVEDVSSTVEAPFYKPGKSRHLVLCIDDDESAVELMSRFLSEDEFGVIHARSGEEGIALARKMRPDVITLDVMMPGVDGWTVLARLKADPELSTIPVIMATITGERQRSFLLGATDYLTKPIQRSRLVSMLRRYCTSEGHVLIVEDDTETRNILQRVLEARGWRTMVARNGVEALELLDAHTPDVMLLDLMMPELDGFGVLERIRANPALADLPVIVLTAMELTVEELQRLNSHVSQVLQKGVTSTNALVDRLRVVLGMSD